MATKHIDELERTARGLKVINYDELPASEQRLVLVGLKLSMDAVRWQILFWIAFVGNLIQ